MVFKGSSEWWHIVYTSERMNTYLKSDLKIVKTCLDNEHAQNCLAYLRDIAGINQLKNEEGQVLLKKQYEKLGFVGENTVLANYLHPNEYPIRNFESGSLIFPFGGNASQFKAVHNALSNQMSIIQGPPGTGKTQTILNIVANLLVRDKTVQIVSNNNSATQNVLEKLSSPKYSLDFLVATLGKKDNKESFVNKQTGSYPDISSWHKDEKELEMLLNRVIRLSSEVSEYFSKQEQLALAKKEINALEVETNYFNQYYEKQKPSKPSKEPREGLTAVTVLHILQEYEAISEQEKKIGLWLKLKSTLLYGIFEWRFFYSNISTIITYMQSLFYRLKHSELSKEINELQDFLDSTNAKEKMDKLTLLSMEYLKAYIYKKYGNKPSRKIFSINDTWEKAGEIIEEYPITLSTTFSAKSSLREVIYDYLIMDEASQVDLATGALALSTAKNAVIVGDLKQLPNVIDNVMRKNSQDIFDNYKLPQGYNFNENSFLKSICSVLPDVPQTLLREHYRCHPKIIDFCNQKFYQNSLIIMTEDNGESNTLSAYKTVKGNHKREHLNQVKTVHKFQGREKEAIIINTVDNEVTDFSDDPYLLNVAISRAKKRLCLVVSGNEQPADSNIKDLIAYIEYNNFDVVDSEIYSVFDLLY